MIAIGPGVPRRRRGVRDDVHDRRPRTDVHRGSLRNLPGPGDGRSLVPFLTDGQTPQGWAQRDAASESIGETNASDPDYLRPYIPHPSPLCAPSVGCTSNTTTGAPRSTTEEPIRTSFAASSTPSIQGLSPPSAPSFLQLDACSGPSCREADALAITDPLPQAKAGWTL